MRGIIFFLNDASSAFRPKSNLNYTQKISKEQLEVWRNRTQISSLCNMFRISSFEKALLHKCMEKHCHTAT